jgi:hypothetical protein
MYFKKWMGGLAVLSRNSSVLPLVWLKKKNNNNKNNLMPFAKFGQILLNFFFDFREHFCFFDSQLSLLHDTPPPLHVKYDNVTMHYITFFTSVDI